MHRFRVVAALAGDEDVAARERVEVIRIGDRATLAGRRRAPRAPACVVEKNAGSISAKSPSARMRSTSTEPTMPRQPIKPVLGNAAIDSPVAPQSGHYSVPDRGANHERRRRRNSSIPPEAAWGPTFDVGRATDAYIATVPAADREKSDAYFEGGYWIELWSTLITVAVCCAAAALRFAARIRDFAAARGAGPFVQVARRRRRHSSPRSRC